MGLIRKSLYKQHLKISLLSFGASLSMLFFSQTSNALNDSPQTFTLDGKLYVVGGASALLDPAVKMTVQVLDPAGQCLLYEEQQTLNTVDSAGLFTINVGSATGSAKRTVNDPGRTMNQIFQNAGPIVANNVPGQTCAGGVYTPTAGAIRYFRIIVTRSATNIADTLTPDIVMDSVPNAMIAQSVQGLERANILQVNNSGATVLTQSNLEALFTTPAYANLQSILAGSFIKTDSSGAALPSYAANPAGAANGDIWFDTLTNEVKYKNAAGVQVVGTGSSGITSLTVGSSMSVNGTVAGTISSSGTIDLTNTGVTAGTYTKMTVDAKGRVTAGTVSLVEGDIPNLTSAGKVSGNAITSGTISGSAGINSSGNLISTGTVSGLTVQATNLRIYNGANYIQMTAPTLAGIVNFTLPDNDGDANQVLTTNGAGVLSWSPAASTLAGDVSGPSGTTSVDKIKGKTITAGSVSGQMMIYDGTAWMNNIMSGDATLAHDGMLSLNKVPVAKGGTNAVAFGNNRIIGTNGTGTALQDFTCALNQVIAFDVSGNAICSNVSALSSAILNGGNSFAGDISVGTNDNQALQFKANNTIAMTISQGGNVGIGISNPTYTLEVNGSLSANGHASLGSTTFTGNSGYTQVVAHNNTGTPLFVRGAAGGMITFEDTTGTAKAWTAGVLDNSSAFTFYEDRFLGASNGTERMRIAAGGNVGIGTAAPAASLHVVGADGPSAGVPNAPAALTVVGGNGNAGGNGAGGAINLTGGNATGNAVAGAVTIASGNYASGGSGSAGAIDILGGSSSGNGSGAIALRGGYYGASQNNTGGYMTVGGSGSITTGSLVLSSGTANGTTPRTGNVTIQTSNASAGEFAGAINITGGNGNGVGAGAAINITAGNGGATNINGANVILNGGAKGGSGTDGNIVLANTRGNVGIGGVTAPTAKLEVQGQARTTGTGGAAQINSSAAVDWNNGNAQSMSVACTSTAFTNMLDGGTYILAISETGTTTCVFAQAGLTFYFNPANSARTSGQRTVYTFQRIGTDVYVSWIAGFQ